MTAFDSIQARARVHPPSDSLRLLVAGLPCGWVAADVPPLLRAPAADLAFDAGTVHLLPKLAGQPASPALQAHVSDALAGIAHGLLQAGRLNGWRNELLDVVADDGTLLGTIERAAVRPLGIATQAVHLNAWTDAGQLWIAQRSFTKSTDPGMWDTLVGGLVSAAETPELALERESWEEAGLLPHHLAGGWRAGAFEVRRALPEGYQIERVTVVDTILGPEVVPENQDGEVAALRVASVDEVMSMVEDGAFTLEAALAVMTSMAARATPVEAAVPRDSARRVSL